MQEAPALPIAKVRLRTEPIQGKYKTVFNDNQVFFDKI